MDDQTTLSWHAMDPDEACERLETTSQGLSEAEVGRRQERFGPNRLKPPQRIGPVKRFLLHFHNVVIYVLLVAAIVAGALGHWIDSAVIFAVVLINASIGFIQEGKAEKALDAVRKMLSPMALVVREGQRQNVPADQLVPGDIVALQSGDKVPADLRLLRLHELRVDEAALTGESVPVDKAVDPVESNAGVGDRYSMAFAGTLVTYGQATGVVVGIGEQTEIGRISEMLAEVEELTTPLLQKISHLGRVISIAIVGAAVLLFVFGLFVRDYEPAEIFMGAVGVAVAAIPEGLPAIITITLAIGVQRMAGRHAIIRRLPAVDTLGSVTVICSDKTGTLTRNEMTVTRIDTPLQTYEVSGVGYAPEGAFSFDGSIIEAGERDDLERLLRAAVLCNDTRLDHAEGEWRYVGEPTEAALVAVGAKGGLDQTDLQNHWPRTDAIPFESEHKFMATLHHSHGGESVIYLKGAPERVLEMCDSQRGEDGAAEPIDTDRWHRQAVAMADNGQRVLAVAQKPTHPHHSDLTFDDVNEGLMLLGLCGMIDPPRQEALEAIGECQRAGIRVKMITGDHARTARAIGEQLNLAGGEEVLTGQQLDALDADELAKRVPDVHVYARVNPAHKLKLVTAIQAHDHVVAMTGDGVNDAPALKRADVGVAMGQNGTEAAKEASEVVLTDDNFASIAHAVEEGRTVYDNLRKAILFILPTNGAQASVVTGAILIGLDELPITPVQILWVNLVTAVTLALALAFEPSEKDVMDRPPRRPGAALLSRFFLWRIAFVSLLLFIVTLGMFLWSQQRGMTVEVARTTAINMLIMGQIVYLFNSRFLTDPSLTLRGLFGNRHVLYAIATVLVLQMLYTYLPWSHELFGTAAVTPMFWVWIVLIAVAIFFIVELEKWVFRRIL